MKRRATILYDVPTIKMPKRWLSVRERRKLLHTSITKNNDDSEPWPVALMIKSEYVPSTFQKAPILLYGGSESAFLSFIYKPPPCQRLICFISILFYVQIENGHYTCECPEVYLPTASALYPWRLVLETS
jgi:hypothetical protein